MNFIDPRVLNGDTPSSMLISLDKTKTRAETQITAAITIDPLPEHYHTNRFPRPNLVRCKQQATDDEVATHEKNNSATRLEFSLVLATAVSSPEDRERAYRRARGDEPTPRRARGVAIAEIDKAAPEHPQNGGAVVICDGCKDRESKRYGRKKKRNAEEEDEWNQYEDERIIMINEKEFKQWKEPPLPHKVQGLSAQARMVEFPLRITCYCRHQEEKPQDDSALYGYRVIFTLKDTAGKLIAQSMSDVIQITDDHKNRETATQQTLVTPTSQQSMAMNQDFYAFHSQPTTPGAFSQPTTPSVPQPVGMFFSSDDSYAQMSGADSAFPRSISTSNLPNMAARSQFFGVAPSRKHHNGVHTPNASASDLTARDVPYTQMPSNVITPYSSTSDLTATDSWCTPVPSNDTFTTSTSMSDDASYNTLSSNGMSSAADFGSIPSWPTSVSGSYDATTGPLTDELTASMSNEAFAIGISPTSSNSDGELTPSFSNSDLSNADVAAMMADTMVYGMSPANSPNEAILGHSHSTSDLAFMGSESMAFGASPTNTPFRGARYPNHQRGQSYNAVRTMNPNAMHTMNGNGMPAMNTKAMHMNSNAMPPMSSGPMQSMNSSVMHPLNTNFNSYAYNRSQSYDSLSHALHQMGCQSQVMNPQVFASQPPSRAASRPASPTWEQGGRSLKKRRSNSAFMLYDEAY